MSAEPYFNSQNDLRMFGRRLQEKEEQLQQEHERAKQYHVILRKLVEAQDEIDIEAEKPLHQRSTAPMVKKIEAIKEARRILEEIKNE